MIKRKKRTNSPVHSISLVWKQNAGLQVEPANRPSQHSALVRYYHGKKTPLHRIQPVAIVKLIIHLNWGFKRAGIRIKVLLAKARSRRAPVAKLILVVAVKDGGVVHDGRASGLVGARVPAPAMP